MKILRVHNRYQLAGGEDTSVAAEVDLLREHGHEVRLLTADSAEIRGWWRNLQTGLQATYSWAARRRLAATLAEFRPAVVHVDNFSRCCRRRFTMPAGLPCACGPNAAKLPADLPERFAVSRQPVLHGLRGPYRALAGVVHACYRDSRLATAAVATMIAVHRLLRTWARKVDVFIVLSPFQRAQLVAGGVPAHKIVIKPNFVHPDPGMGPGGATDVVFVGRLSREKDLATLLTAWRLVKHPLRLRIVGDGPLRGELQRLAQADRRIEMCGHLALADVYRLLQSALVLVLPSRSPETFGRTIVEAYATGLPVIASNLGSQASLVRDGVTGRLFPVGDAAALAEALRFFAERPGEIAAMRRAARAEYEAHYTAAKNYEQLLAVYERAIATGSTQA